MFFIALEDNPPCLKVIRISNALAKWGKMKMDSSVKMLLLKLVIIKRVIIQNMYFNDEKAEFKSLGP